MIMTVIRYIGEKLNGVAYTVDPELAERISLEKIEKEKALICNKVGEVIEKYGEDNPKFAPYIKKLRERADVLEKRLKDERGKVAEFKRLQDELKIKKAQLKDDIEMEKQLKDMVGSTRTYSGFLRKKNSKLQQEITGLEEQINTINRNA
jgi:predicted RNase H-like nuclease (RuvC/YqgF family)